MSPQVSVIVPTYNRPRSLAMTLQALAEQTLSRQEYEVIVVDDGSTDNTAGCVSDFARAHPDLILRYERHKTNRFKAAACNTGIAAAESPLLAFTDDDIRPVPGWLNAHVQRHKAEGRTVAVTGLVLYPPDWERSSNWVRFANDNYRASETVRPVKIGGMPPNRWAGGNTSLARDLIVAAGGFDESIRRGQDGELGCRLFKMGVPLLFEPKALVYHYAEAIRSIDNTLKVFRKYYERDRLMVLNRHPWSKKYGHWFLEPIDLDEDACWRVLMKVCVRVIARPSLAKLVLCWLKFVDGNPRLYWRPLYQYVMASTALDAIRASRTKL